MGTIPLPERYGNERKIMQAVARGLEEIGIPAVDAEAFEAGGMATKPEFADMVRTMQEGDGDVANALSALEIGSPDPEHSVFGDHSGQSVVTSRYGHRDITVPEAIEEMDNDGLIEGALNAVYAKTGDKQLSMDVIQYTLWLFAKGWIAEKAIANSDEFANTGEAGDIGGQDLYSRERSRYEQLKAVSHGYRARQDDGKRGNHTVDGVPVVYYQFDGDGGLVVGLDHCKVNGKAADRAGYGKTVYWKELMWG